MVDEYFSKNYFEAREKFLNACNENGFEIKSELHPKVKGPQNRDIFMDCAVKGPNEAKQMLLIISGTHGPEGYCGSGFQYGLLKSGIANEWAKTHKIAFIHAHNAYGFAWDTRFNEDNIDLNRNYLEDWNNPPKNPDYDELAQWALPTDYSEENENLAMMKLMEYAQKNGFPKLQAALTAGQYNHPKGVYYGGNGPSWSNITIKKFVNEITKEIEKIVIIDMHTGLGPFGKGEILCDCAPNTDEYKRLHSIWGDEVVSTKTEASVSADLSGTLDSGLTKLLSKLSPAFIAIEFGTIDPLSVFKSTQGTSWLHTYGDKESEIGKKLTQLSRDAFYPQSSEWNEKVWTRSVEVAQKAIESFE